MHTDFDRCYRAVQSKDARFDGWFVTAVVTTGIYCRPSCPVRPPKASNMRFYATAAAAQEAGFRACKRCRPDATPGSPEWDVRADVVGRAMRLISDGVVDREGVAGLAYRLGYSVRQVERHLVAAVGAGPLALARAQRAQTARVLIETTALPFAEVAFAAGFASIRQFNDTVRSVFALPPTELRRKRERSERGSTTGGAAPGALVLRLPLRSPFCPDNLFGHLAATSVPGCEEATADRYRRTLRLPHGAGTVDLRPRPDYVECLLRLGDLRDLPAAIARTRLLLDLDADPEAFDDLLADDPLLAPLVKKAPGRRVPRTTDGAEFALRAVLGQQVSTAAARTHAARLVAAHGDLIGDPDGGLTRLFPSIDQLAEVDVTMIAVPAARRRTIAGLLAALAARTVELDTGSDWQRAREGLASIAGVGPWTTEMIAMRALGDPDAFPATDMGVRRAARALGIASNDRELIAWAERWRPWRAYATQYLWATLDHPINAWTGPAREKVGTP